MRLWTPAVVLLALLACGGCSKEKSTEELISDLKSPNNGARIVAVRLLPERRGAAAEVIPGLIEALKDPSDDVRRSAANGLMELGEQAKEALPALRVAMRDSNFMVREAATRAVKVIDPQNAPKNEQPAKPGK
jgi:vesicle coat complex subunit